jgi:hypothetical protein
MMNEELEKRCFFISPFHGMYFDTRKPQRGEFRIAQGIALGRRKCDKPSPEGAK